jgi:hypothetical protein
MQETPRDDVKALDAMSDDESRDQARALGFVLDDWSVNTDPFQKNEMDQRLPWEDVDASRRNRRLQKRHPLPIDIVTHFAQAKACPACHAPPKALTWFYFRSPTETWAMECGTAGWMAVCDRCRVQVNYFQDAIS